VYKLIANTVIEPRGTKDTFKISKTCGLPGRCFGAFLTNERTEVLEHFGLYGHNTKAFFIAANREYVSIRGRLTSFEWHLPFGARQEKGEIL